MIAKENLINDENKCVIVLMVLPERLKDYNDKFVWKDNANKIFKDNIQLMDIIYYGDEDKLEDIYDEVEYYLTYIRPYEYYFNFIFDPENKLNSKELDYKMWETDIAGYCKIDLDYTITKG